MAPCQEPGQPLLSCLQHQRFFTGDQPKYQFLKPSEPHTRADFIKRSPCYTHTYTYIRIYSCDVHMKQLYARVSFMCTH